MHSEFCAFLKYLYLYFFLYIIFLCSQRFVIVFLLAAKMIFKRYVSLLLRPLGIILRYRKVKEVGIRAQNLWNQMTNSFPKRFNMRIKPTNTWPIPPAPCRAPLSSEFTFNTVENIIIFIYTYIFVSVRNCYLLLGSTKKWEIKINNPRPYHPYWFYIILWPVWVWKLPNAFETPSSFPLPH